MGKGNGGDSKGESDEDDSDAESGESGEGGDGKSSEGGNSKSKGGTEDGDAEIDGTFEDIDEIRKDAEEVLKKYANKLTGPIGEYISKCKSSASLKRDGLKVNTYRGHAGWNTEMNQICQGFVKAKVFEKKRQYEKTYSRVKRGSGFVKFGQPIEPGRKIKEDKMNIDVAFYIDKSYSMKNSIDNVYKAVFYIAQALKKQFGIEKVVDKVIFKSFAFDNSLHELEFGKTMSASGGTMSFNDLLKCIGENTKDYLINVIVTDAEFQSINVNNIKDLLKSINGIILFITNEPEQVIENMAKENKNKLYYILANKQFTLD